MIGGGNVTKVPYPNPYRCALGPCDRDGCSLECLEHVERWVLGATSPAADTAAVIMEAVQSDGGDVVPPANDIPALRELCDAHGIWLVFDEVKTGLGRTGRMFAFEHAGVVADAVTLGKPLGGGLPLSAVVGRRSCSTCRRTACSRSAARPSRAPRLATLDVIADEGLVDNAARWGCGSSRVCGRSRGARG